MAGCIKPSPTHQQFARRQRFGEGTTCTPSPRHFLLQSQVPGKHPSDPTVVWHMLVREPKKVVRTNYFENVHVYAGATRLGSNGGRGVTFKSECEDNEGVGCGHQ